MKWILLGSALILGMTGCAGRFGSGEGGILIETPWARATAGRIATGVVYLRLHNRGTESERLISISTPIAATAGLHETTREHGMMSMRQRSSVEIRANEVIDLEPGGLHIMLMHLRSPLEEGNTFPLNLRFEHAGPIEIQVEVQSVGATRPHVHE